MRRHHRLHAALATISAIAGIAVLLWLPAVVSIALAVAMAVSWCLVLER